MKTEFDLSTLKNKEIWFLKGIITEIQESVSIITIDFEERGIIIDVPIAYKCQKDYDSEGVLGYQAFRVEDEVIVEWRPPKGDIESSLIKENLRLIGFIDGFPRCCKPRLRIAAFRFDHWIAFYDCGCGECYVPLYYPDSMVSVVKEGDGYIYFKLNSSSQAYAEEFMELVVGEPLTKGGTSSVENIDATLDTPIDILISEWALRQTETDPPIMQEYCNIRGTMSGIDSPDIPCGATINSPCHNGLTDDYYHPITNSSELMQWRRTTISWTLEADGVNIIPIEWSSEDVEEYKCFIHSGICYPYPHAHAGYYAHVENTWCEGNRTGSVAFSGLCPHLSATPPTPGISNYPRTHYGWSFLSEKYSYGVFNSVKLPNLGGWAFDLDASDRPSFPTWVTDVLEEQPTPYNPVDIPIIPDSVQFIVKTDRTEGRIFGKQDFKDWNYDIFGDYPGYPDCPGGCPQQVDYDWGAIFFPTSGAGTTRNAYNAVRTQVAPEISVHELWHNTYPDPDPNHVSAYMSDDWGIEYTEPMYEDVRVVCYNYGLWFRTEQYMDVSSRGSDILLDHEVKRDVGAEKRTHPATVVNFTIQKWLRPSYCMNTLKQYTRVPDYAIMDCYSEQIDKYIKQGNRIYLSGKKVIDALMVMELTETWVSSWTDNGPPPNYPDYFTCSILSAVKFNDVDADTEWAESLVQRDNAGWITLFLQEVAYVSSVRNTLDYFQYWFLLD